VLGHGKVPRPRPAGIVADELPGERGWIKTKNRDYWRWELEREGVLRSQRLRAFVV
jgi:hypothetical protein